MAVRKPCSSLAWQASYSARVMKGAAASRGTAGGRCRNERGRTCPRTCEKQPGVGGAKPENRGMDAQNAKVCLKKRMGGEVGRGTAPRRPRRTERSAARRGQVSTAFPLVA